MEQSGSKRVSDSTSAWSPLRLPIYRALWLASVASNIGTWMHEVANAWLMTTLTSSPLLVALIQTAEAMPIFALALPAGALADVMDRRKLLLITQTWMLLVASALGAVTLAGAMTPNLLLILTAAMGAGVSLNMPAWQAITPELVGSKELASAVALGGVGLNLARVVGPAVGGLLVAAIGPGFVFLLNSASFVGVIIVLRQWRRNPKPGTLPAEDIMGAMRAGVRYMRYSPKFQAVLVRTGSVVLCSSAMWALLPVIARHELGVGAAGYGVILGCLGCGAVTGAAVLPGLRRRFSVDLLTACAAILTAGVLLVLSFFPIFSAVMGVMFLAGVAHMTLLSSFNVAAQQSVAAWVRARSLAVYLLIFQGAMALGGFVWGAVAGHASVALALIAAALGLMVSLAAVPKFQLESDDMELTPSQHWPVPVVVPETQHDDGPVLITVEYRVDPTQRADFSAATRKLRLSRLRDGAIRWGLYCDMMDNTRFVETFIVESWVEHLRQHERATKEDKHAEDAVIAFHRGTGPPTVTHYSGALLFK